MHLKLPLDNAVHVALCEAYLTLAPYPEAPTVLTH